VSTQTRPREDIKEKKKQEIVNDFSIQVATVNGSGSQSSNNVLMRAIFRMGVPISGKNLFPSNIAGGYLNTEVIDDFLLLFLFNIFSGAGLSAHAYLPLLTWTISKIPTSGILLIQLYLSKTWDRIQNLQAQLCVFDL